VGDEREGVGVRESENITDILKAIISTRP